MLIVDRKFLLDFHPGLIPVYITSLIIFQLFFSQVTFYTKYFVLPIVIDVVYCLLSRYLHIDNSPCYDNFWFFCDITHGILSTICRNYVTRFRRLWEKLCLGKILVLSNFTSVVKCKTHCRHWYCVPPSIYVGYMKFLGDPFNQVYNACNNLRVFILICACLNLD